MRDGVQQRGCDSRASPVDCARDARGVRAGRLADSRRRRGLDTCRDLSNNALSGPIPDLFRLTVLTKALLLGNNFLGGIGTECTSASKALLLEGAAVQTSSMGLYTEIAVTVDNDYAQRDGRPVFFGQGQYLFYYSSSNDWNVGPSLGSTAVSLYVVSAAQHPTAITGAWIEYGSNGWVGAPNLKVTCLRQ